MEQATDQFGELVKTGFGWIKPDGTILACEMYNHWDSISSSFGDLECPQAKAIIEAYEQERDRMASPHNALIAAGEHPEWHTFEMWEDYEKPRARDRIYAALYKAGWVRVGRDRDANMLSFEGTSAALEKHKQAIRDIRLSFDLTADEVYLQEISSQSCREE
jgi:hypothetical protein